ncbi:MAG: hypothetical protein M0R66_02465 [Candidatus Omnitrophica bacterium]|nr:hypothetical protein [Candidatus Omnitrophota bacterium]
MPANRCTENEDHLGGVTNIFYLPDGWEVVDLDTGTTLGTNLRLVYNFPSGLTRGEPDSDIAFYASAHGKPLYLDNRDMLS